MFKIKQFHDYKATKIEKGWSDDIKYLLEKGSEKILLRVSDIDQFEQKKHEFEMLKQMEQAEIPTNRPIDFGIDDENAHVFMALTWIEGQDLRDVIGEFSESKQYQLGLEAGEILKKIHQLPITQPTHTWEKHFNEKIDRRLKQYEACEIKLPNDQLFLQYINQHRHLLAKRPWCFHHGDYHIGNMILASDGKVIPIDLNRLDIGDPWEEFNRIVFCKDDSPAFAKGRVDGYFAGEVPDDFWKLLALYVANNTLGGLPWAVKFGGEEVEFMLRQAEGVLADYEDMKRYVPKWYSLAEMEEKKDV